MMKADSQQHLMDTKTIQYIATEARSISARVRGRELGQC